MKKLILLLLFIPLLSCSGSDDDSTNETSTKYTLTTISNPVEAGSVSPITGQHNEGVKVKITATPNTSWIFKDWNGDLSGTENPKEITMDKSKTVTALFEKQPPFFFDDNGVTIKARDWVTAGTTGELKGITYKAVDRNELVNMIRNKEDLTKIVTTLVTNLDRIFCFCVPGVIPNNEYLLNFNQNIASWDVSNVTSMWQTFEDAHSFNQDISKWDVSNVTSMLSTFKFAHSFNQDISKWDVSNVKFV
jgi:surface protein